MDFKNPHLKNMSLKIWKAITGHVEDVYWEIASLVKLTA